MNHAATPLATAEDPMVRRIRQRAHEIYLIRGKSPGSALQDWLKAEAEVLRREAAIDEASEESFPASDPPAH